MITPDRVAPITLHPAGPDDLAAVRAALAGANLPLGGLARDFPPGFVLARAATGELVGCAGVERHGDAGLLRSVVVPPSARGLGLGRRLVVDRCAWGRAHRLSALYLLTTDAAEFFARLGFTAVARDRVDASVRASEEFASICPASATCMSLSL